MENDWINGVKPPNEEWVEVLSGSGEVQTAKAVYGRDGTLPHWETKDGLHCHPSRFNSWRPINAVQQNEGKE
jgi:hypothetical protein